MTFTLNHDIPLLKRSAVSFSKHWDRAPSILLGSPDQCLHLTLKVSLNYIFFPFQVVFFYSFFFIFSTVRSLLCILFLLQRRDQSFRIYTHVNCLHWVWLMLHVQSELKMGLQMMINYFKQIVLVLFIFLLEYRITNGTVEIRSCINST